MRSVIVITALLICGCQAFPYFNLQKPIYLVAETSFWSGCDKDPKGEKACQEFRVKQVYTGINQWFGKFSQENRPKAKIFFSENDLPVSRAENEVVHLKIEPGNCHKDEAACYGRDNSFSPVYIVYESVEWITPIISAHEFGHVCGRDDNDVPEKTRSVMSYALQVPVTSLDIKMVCALHAECRMQKAKPKVVFFKKAKK